MERKNQKDKIILCLGNNNFGYYESSIWITVLFTDFTELNYNQPVLMKHHGSQSESMFTPNFTELQVKPVRTAKPCTYAYICKPHSYAKSLKLL